MSGNHLDKKVFEMNDSCICCTVRGDLNRPQLRRGFEACQA